MLSGIKHDQTEADFKMQRLQPADGILIASDLRVNAVLTSIDVGGNSIGKEAALSLVSIFKEKDQMKSVGLANCDLGVDGAKAVAEYVKGSAVLKSLLLLRNNIGAEGAKALADALASGKAVLTDLNLHFNDIGPEGGKAIAEALKSGTAVLTKLECVRAALERATLIARASLAHQRNLLDAAHPPVPFARHGTPAFAHPRPVSGARARLSEHSSRRASKALAFLSAFAPDAIPFSRRSVRHPLALFQDARSPSFHATRSPFPLPDALPDACSPFFVCGPLL